MRKSFLKLIIKLTIKSDLNDSISLRCTDVISGISRRIRKKVFKIFRATRLAKQADTGAIFSYSHELLFPRVRPVSVLVIPSSSRVDHCVYPRVAAYAAVHLHLIVHAGAKLSLRQQEFWFVVNSPHFVVCLSLER